MSHALRSNQSPNVVLFHNANRFAAVDAGPGAVIVDANSRPDSRASNDNSRRARDMQLRLAADSPAGRAGELITLSVTPADTSDQNKEIDTWLGGFQNFGFLADMVAPVVLVDQEKANRRDFLLENVFEVVETRVGRHGAINEIEHMSQTAPYETEEHALAAYIPYAAEVEAVKNYNVRQAHAQMIAEKLALSREVKVFDLLTTLASWATTNRTQLISSTQWDDGGSKDPLLDLHTRVNASAQRVTSILMNPDVAYYFLADTKVRDYLRTVYGDGAPDANLALASNEQGIVTFNILGLPPVTIAPAKKKNPSTGALDFILGNDVLLLSNVQGAPQDGTRMSTCVTFRTKGRSGTGWTTNEYVPQGGRGLEGGTMMESGYKETVFFGSNLCGGLIKDVLP